MASDIRNKSLVDKFIERGIIFLLVFTPLAFGGVPTWSFSIMEITAFVIFGIWLVNWIARNQDHLEKTPILYFAGAFIALVVFQLVPMPQRILAIISPSAAGIYTLFDRVGSGSWRTVSLYPDATKEELYKLLAYTAVFVIVINHFRTREQIAKVLHAIIMTGCFMTVFAIVQKMIWNGSLYWFYPVGPGIKSDGQYIWGPYINHNHFAGYMEMATPLALGMLLYTLSKNKFEPKQRFLQKIAAILVRKEFMPLMLLSAAVILLAGGLFSSLSRGGIIGFAVSILLFAVMTRSRRSLRKKSAIIGLVGFAVFALVVAASWDRIESRFGKIGKVNNVQRIKIWGDSISVTRDFPVVGTGLGTFASVYPHYQTEYGNILFEHAENDYIEILTDTGLAGFFLFSGIVSVYFWKLLKSWSKRHSGFVLSVGAGGLSSCAAIVAHSLTDFNLRIPANALTLTVIGAITYAAIFNINSGKQLLRGA